jgi:uncharacterized protein
MNPIFQQIQSEIKTIFDSDSSGHDLYHLQRVFNLAMTIQAKEGGDKIVIGAAALTHDLHRIIEVETGKFYPSRDSLPQVKAILDKTDLTDDQKKHILHCVEFHEEYNFSKGGKTVQDLETLILQDADNLDAMGAIGIARTFMFGGAHHVPMWIPELPADREHYDEASRDPSVIHHFHSKLLKLKDNMNTPTGMEMAQERHRVMERFIQEFKEEWDGLK